MSTFNSYNEMAVANGSAPYIPMHLRDADETDNMSPRFKGIPIFGTYFFGNNSSEDGAVGGMLEPPHVHVSVIGSGNDVAKLWLEDERTGRVSEDPHKSKGIPSHELSKVIKHVQKNIVAAFAAWDKWVRDDNLQAKMNPKELAKFNEREKKRGNQPYIPAQQKPNQR